MIESLQRALWSWFTEQIKIFLIETIKNNILHRQWNAKFPLIFFFDNWIHHVTVLHQGITLLPLIRNTILTSNSVLVLPVLEVHVNGIKDCVFSCAYEIHPCYWFSSCHLYCGVVFHYMPISQFINFLFDRYLCRFQFGALKRRLWKLLYKFIRT